MKPFKPEDIIALLLKNGWIVDHMTGSHKIMYHPGLKKRTTVPVHRKDLPVGTTLAILRQTGLSKQDLLDFEG